MIELDKDDVVSTSSKSSNFGLGLTFKVGELVQSAIEWIATMNQSPFCSWFYPDGIKCKVLQAQGGGWQSGKLRFRLEFIPDNPQPTKPKDPNSPLDDLRSNLDI